MRSGEPAVTRLWGCPLGSRGEEPGRARKGCGDRAFRSGRCARDVVGTGQCSEGGRGGWRVLGRWADQGGRSPAAGLDELGSRVCGGLRWEGAETAHTGSSNRPGPQRVVATSLIQGGFEGVGRRHCAGSTCARPGVAETLPRFGAVNAQDLPFFLLSKSHRLGEAVHPQPAPPPPAQQNTGRRIPKVKDLLVSPNTH